jgi:DNA-binding NarL/FixJ family response regulator
VELREAVLIVDADAASRADMAATIGLAGFTVAEAGTGDEALLMARTTPLAALILEIPLPGISGYEVCRSVRSELGPSLPIIFVSGVRTEPFDRVAGLLIGADDYLTKPVAPDELLTRLRALVDRAEDAAQPTQSVTLTRREQEVLELVSEGLLRREVAARLYISPKTVATHMEHILRKLGVSSRAEAIAVAYRDHLVGARPRAGPSGSGVLRRR